MNIFKKHKTLFIILLLLILVSLWLILIDNGEYGTTLFFSIPFTISYLVGYNNRYNSSGTTILTSNLRAFLKINLIIIGLSALLLAIGMEGAICILMAYPYLLIPTTIAFILGRSSGKFDSKMNYSVAFILVLLNPTTYIFDNYSTPIESTIRTSVIIDSNIQNIMDKLNSKITFSDKPDFLFEKGVSYPKSIEFIPNNKLGYYSCITNNDTILLNITKLNDAEIRFSPEENTLPMKELSPYNTINAEHLHNYFQVNYGGLNLYELSNSKTQVIATTNYNYAIAPKWYWALWSDYIIDKMHRHVLNSLESQL